jgi:nucleoside phosphorylase
MSERDAKDLITEAETRGLRRALIVTALGLEMDAVRAHLSEPCSVLGRDGNFYECGIFSALGQDWLVVVVETGAGTHQAQNAVQHAHFLLGEFEVQILIGIGGSRKEDDAPLGGVVASDHVYMPYGGKDTDRGRMSRPREFPVDPRLVGLARKIRRDREWPSRVRPPLDGAMPAPDAYPFEMPPVGHVAPIASVEAVVAGRKSALEAMLKRDYNDACVVEMEGYGAIYAAASERTPSIVVRGVSDLADKKEPTTDKMRQPVAACHAAAFGFELLARWGSSYSAPVRLLSREPEAPNAPSELPPIDRPPEPAGAVEPAEAPAAVAVFAVTERVVLNLDLAAAEVTPERIAELEAALRQLTGSANLAIVATEEGSLRLVVEDPTGALGNLDLASLSERLQQEGAPLLGRVDEAEYRKLEAIQEELRIASGDLMSWPTTLPEGERIERPELVRLLEVLRGGTSSTTALLGDPGAGKSALLATFCAVVMDQVHWPLLAIKADLLPTELTNEDQLAKHLDLSDRPSVLLTRVAKLRPVVLVVDQLDALAAHLDLRTGRLNVLMNLIRRLGDLDNVHIVLSSRTFEFEHDVRLRTIRAQDIRLELPTWLKVSEILKAYGVEADGWPEDAQRVMRSPQALTIYLGLDRATGTEMFVSYQGMLERLWSERVTSGNRGQERSKLVSELAEQMAAEETLWLPRIRFEYHEADIKMLESAGVLTPLGGEGSLGFTHQTLFDHALARSFARGPGRLSQYVLDRQTSLFLRPKLWAALTYLRGVDPVSYGSELETIWVAQGLRFHLRLLLIDFVGQQGSPTDREVLLLDRALTDPATRAIALKAISGSAGWFDRLASSRIAEAMTTDPDLARIVLMGASVHAPDEVISLIEDRWLPDPSFDGNAWMVLQNMPVWSETTLGVADRVLQRTAMSPYAIDYVVGTLGLDQPLHALALVRSKLDQDFQTALAESTRRAGEPKPEFDSISDEVVWRHKHDVRQPIKQLIEQSQDWFSLPALAEKWPQEFLDVLWPWFLNVFAALRSFERREDLLLGYAVPYDADFRFDDEQGAELAEPTLLAAVRTAAETLATEQPDEFRAWIAAQADVDAMPVHRLIAHVLALNPEAMGEFAFQYLMGDTRRWRLGAVSNLMATTKKLIACTSEHWTVDDLARFEKAVMAYDPPPPPSHGEASQRRSWRQSIRRLRLDLLRSLPRSRASAEVRRKIQEEERAFPGEHEDVRGVQGGLVGSRMDANGMAKASDDDILNAFRALPDATNWNHPTDWMMGGNIQLSREFATFAKTHPDRAFRIMDQFTPEIGTRGAGYALEAMAEHGDAGAIQRAFITLEGRGFDSDEFRMSCAGSMERLARRKADIRAEVVTILEKWLTQLPTPPEGPDESGRETAEGIDTSAASTREEREDGDAANRSPLWGYRGISILPGGDYPIMSSLIHVRLARKESETLMDTLEAFLQQPSSSRLWESLLHHIPYISPGDPDRRPALIRGIFDKYPKLLPTQAAAHLLASAHWWSDDVARDLLTREEWNEKRIGRQAWGELVGLIRVVRPQVEWARELTAQLLDAPKAMDARAGAAMSAVNVWSDLNHRKGATDLLVELIDREESGIWSAAFDFFRLVNELTPDVETVRLLTAIADHISSAPKLTGTFVVERLQSLLPHEADLVGRIALGLIGIWKGELGDIRTSHALAAPELVDLAVTLHRLGPETRDIGTRLFEELIALDAYSARDTLDQIDSRFRSIRGASRPRLSRRLPKGRGRRAIGGSG